MKLAEIIADGGVDDGLVIDDSLVKTQSYLVSGLFGPYTAKINCQVRCALRNVWI